MAVLGNHADRRVLRLRPGPAAHLAGVRVTVGLPGPPPGDPRGPGDGRGRCGLFLTAHGVGLLFAARALQGAAVGAATSAAGAALIDLQPDRSGRAPVVTSAAGLLGLGAGGLGTSALVQYAPAPTQLVWWLLLGASAAAAVAVLAIPETAPGAPGRWPRCGRGWPCRGRHGGRSRWPCRA